MSVKLINDGCSTEAANIKNSGKQKQCVPKPIERLFLSKEGFSFTNKANSVLLASWKTAIANKDIIPLYKVEEFSANNTEEKKYEGRFEDYPSEEAVKGTNYNILIGNCSYEALESYEGTDYLRIFGVLTDGLFTAELQENGTIKGQPLSSYNVGVLNDSEIGGKVQNADIEVKFKKHSISNIKPAFDLDDLDGIQDVTLTIISASSTAIVVTATAGCQGDKVSGLETANFRFLNASGTPQTLVASEVDGTYTLTGTGFVTGTLETNGVITQTNAFYEAEQVIVTVS